MTRTLSYRAIDSQGQPVSGCPVVIMTRKPLPIPATTPPLVGRYVLGTVVTGADGSWSFDTDADGPLMAVAWDPNNSTLQPLVLEPVEG